MTLNALHLHLVLTAVLSTQVAHAHAAPNPETASNPDTAPKPANRPSKVLLDRWNDVGRKLIAMAEDFPEDRYDFKPSPTERTFAEQLLHTAVNVNYFVNSLTRGMTPTGGDVKRSDYPTKASVVDYLKKSFAEGAALIKNKGDKGMSDLCIDPFNNQQVRFSDLAWVFIEHSGEHYGQLVVYYRISGMVPPESRPK